MRIPVKDSIVVIAVVGLGYAGPASAYLDPGTGSILLQGLIAAVVGASVALRLYWSKVKEFMATIFPNKKAPPPEDDAQQDQT